MFVVSALSTCDPGNVHTAIAAAKSAKIRVSVVSVAAEMVGHYLPLSESYGREQRVGILYLHLICLVDPHLTAFLESARDIQRVILLSS